ncbi:branched-chain amino acid ABC transporter ATP-binding protein/permease [Paenarthrobacter sp. Z7-10]|uniref:branched-chain amino acid ABC transporter ATP-binding protein/permease n=1 Tax=Paenarthrobacter sp. Z7-10 TaxID=2787635 RepID=UPI0022A9A60A|nr:branched-chain amino acid ABC transporter ATP-binding protein/permease [Paenarthrobacter sp. Z7-10]MCZ2404474.1 branched-chain amino acid ABC transporter ATP-binding protein/permease [Paenarthrobacter sp. Z7-10]
MNLLLDKTRTLPGRIGLTVLAVVAALAVAEISSPFLAQQWALWIIFGQLALSLTFVWGYGGIFSFGQAALFGIGLYSYGAASINISPITGETYSSLLIAGLVAGLFALILGYFIFGIITLAVTLVLLTFMSSTGSPDYHIGSALLGGYNGMSGIPPLGSLASPLNAGYLLIFVVALAAIIVFILDLLLRRPIGRALVAVRENELRSQLLGYDVRRARLNAFVIGGVIAGLAGGEYAAWGQFANPAVFSLQQAALVIIWALVGGRRSLFGAFIGTIVIQEIQNVMGGIGGELTPLVLGGILILVVLLAPEGIMAAVYAFLQRIGLRVGRRPIASRPTVATDVEEHRPNSAGELLATDVTKSFGGVHAVKTVTAEFHPMTTTALLGPNGAGKSTFFSLLVGRHQVTSGKILLNGRDITRLPPHRRAQLGLGIKTQVPSVYNEMTVRENVWLAAYAKKRNVAESDAVTESVLKDFGITERQEALVGDLAHGQRQWLEIAMVVAGHPEVVLLDEPTAGMTRDETSRTVDLVKQLAHGATVVVVEHDMDFVRQLDSDVVMLHQGEVFRRGTIEELRHDEQVLDIYLGRAVTNASDT